MSVIFAGPECLQISWKDRDGGVGENGIWCTC